MDPSKGSEHVSQNGGTMRMVFASQRIFTKLIRFSLRVLTLTNDVDSDEWSERWSDSWEHS
jgi:hypothetical protein